MADINNLGQVDRLDGMTPDQRLRNMVKGNQKFLQAVICDDVRELFAQLDRYEKALRVIADDNGYNWIHARPSPRKIAQEALGCE